MDMSDTELLTRFRQGDRQAFDVLVRKYTDSIYSYVYRLVQNVPDASDISQETFIKCWKSISTFKLGKSFKSWLFAIARNTTFDFLRKRKDQPFSAFDDIDGGNSIVDEVADTHALADELFAKTQDVSMLEHALTQLNTFERDVLLLYYSSDMTFEEVGVVLGVPLHTAKSRHRRALHTLRGILDGMHQS